MKLFVVTLYPYEDGSEARYQFDNREMAEDFAAKVNALPEETLSDISERSKADKVEVWVSGTYDSVEEAWSSLTDGYGDLPEEAGDA